MATDGSANRLPHIPWNSDHGRVTGLTSLSNQDREPSEESRRIDESIIVIADHCLGNPVLHVE